MSRLDSRYAWAAAVALFGALTVTPVAAQGQPDRLPTSQPTSAPSSQLAVPAPPPPPPIQKASSVPSRLRARIEHGDPGVRRAAVVKLGRIRTATSTRLLGRALRDDVSAPVRLAAVQALRRHGPVAYPFLHRAAQDDPDPAVNRAARIAARSLRGRPGYDRFKIERIKRIKRIKRTEEPRFHSRRRLRAPRSVRLFLGCGVVTMLPVGSWTRHPYAGRLAPEDLDHFGPGAGARVELGLGWPRMMLGLVLEINSLDVGAWEDFAAERGDHIDGRAHAVALYVQGAVQLVARGPVRFDLHIATGWAQGFGGETFDDLGLDYDYSFLVPTLSFRQGAAFSWLATPHVDLVVGLDHNIAIGGVDYPGSRQRPLWSFTLSLGARFWPVERRRR